MEGKTDYKPVNEAMGERWHVIGEGKNPILICRKKEVRELFSATFWTLFEMWKLFHHKIEPPDMKWSEVDPDVLSIIISMESYFQNNFSQQSVIIKYQEAIIKTLRAIGGFKK